MKFGLQVFAIVAVGVLSTNSAFAQHHSDHHARGVAVRGSGSHSAATAKTGVSTNTAPIADRGPHHAATMGPGPSNKLGPADTTIDSSIIVDRGGEANKNIKERLIAKTKAFKITGARDVGPKYQHVLNRRQEAPVGSNGGLQRNAIGALVDHNAPNHVAVVPTTGPVAREIAPKPVLGNVPLNKSRPGGTTAVRMSLSLNGTGLNRPGVGTGTIGGPARINTGVLSGNMFHPKHP